MQFGTRFICQQATNEFANHRRSSTNKTTIRRGAAAISGLDSGRVTAFMVGVVAWPVVSRRSRVWQIVFIGRTLFLQAVRAETVGQL
jgi:hypothetical protein